MEDFEQWVHARGGALARSAYLLTGDLHLAEDLVQETLSRVAQHWKRVSRRGNPDAYARQVMHNLAIDRWRRRSVRPPELLTDSHPEVGHGGPDVERVAEHQPAAVLGCSVSTVKSQTRDALARLRSIAPEEVLR